MSHAYSHTQVIHAPCQARQKDFFGRAGGLGVGEREEEYNKIRKDYLKVATHMEGEVEVMKLLKVQGDVNFIAGGRGE